MKPTIVLLALTLCGCGTDESSTLEALQAGAVTVQSIGRELYAITVVNHLVPCDSQTHHDTWINTTGRPIYVRKVEMFEGANFQSSVSDVAFKLGRAPDDMIIATYPRDAYEGSSRNCAPHVTDFHGDFITVRPAEGLVAHQFCSNIRSSPEMLFTATVWYAWAP